MPQVVAPGRASGPNSLAHLEAVPLQRDQAAGHHRGLCHGPVDEGASSPRRHASPAAGGKSPYGLSLPWLPIHFLSYPAHSSTSAAATRASPTTPA